jgi:hypothetical protein
VNSESNDTLAAVFGAYYDVKPQGNVNPLQVRKKPLLESIGAMS